MEVFLSSKTSHGIYRQILVINQNINRLNLVTKKSKLNAALKINTHAIKSINKTR